MVLEEISLAKTVLLIFGGLLAFAIFLRARERRDVPTMAVAGLIFGVTVIGVGQWLVALAGLTVYAIVDRSLPKPVARRLAAVFLGSALLVLLPLITWNSYYGGGLLLTSADAGLNLYLGNNPLSTGLTGRPFGLRDVPEYEENDSRQLAERDAGHPLTPAGVSRHWSQRAVAWAFGNPGKFLDTTRKKVTVLWNSYEIPDSYHFAFIRAQYIPWLWIAGTFAIVGPLGLIGLVLAAGHRPARPLYVICLGYLAVIALFYVRSRYRMPGLPFLMIFAAATIDWTLRVLGREDWRPAAAIAAAAAVTGLFVNQTYCEPPRKDAPAICLGGDVWFDLEWQKLAEWYERQGDIPTAAGYLHRAAAGESLRGPGPLFLWMGRLELDLAERARAAGDAANATKHLTTSAAALERAAGYGYRPGQTQTHLASVYRLQGHLDKALAASQAAVRARPNDPTVVLAAVRSRVALGRCDEAARLRDDFRRLSPGNTQADELVAGCVGS
jgi:tetratricopeptide (TPR) repeat protein